MKSIKWLGARSKKTDLGQRIKCELELETSVGCFIPLKTISMTHFGFQLKRHQYKERGSKEGIMKDVFTGEDLMI